MATPTSEPAGSLDGPAQRHHRSADLHDPLLGLVLSARAALGQTERWRVSTTDDPADPWIHVEHVASAMPLQGWKLHVSSSVWDATRVLRRVLPILLADDADFKIASSLKQLGLLNEADGGQSQIGKFVTVYPNDDAQAVRLAIALDEATRGLRGPAIPSDRPLRPGSLVYYRYGGFGDQHVLTLMGELLPAIARPDGELVPDRRPTTYAPPAWAVDPFLAAGVATELEERSPLVGGRYLIAATLHQSARGAVHLAADVLGQRRCVLKRASRDASLDLDGRDARDRLRHEAAVLATLAGDPRFPIVYDLVEQDGDLLLVMEDVDGQTLDVHIGQLAVQGRLPEESRIVALGIELADLLDAVHAHGYVYRDLKSNNVILAADGRLRLIDLELAFPAGSQRVDGLGTRGYMSPQQADGLPPSVQDDIYSLGALLYLLATGIEPSWAPDPLRLLSRPIELLNPRIGPGLIATIERCLSSDPAVRFETMAAVRAALTEAGRPGETAPTPTVLAVPLPGPEHHRELARRLGDTLVAAARPDAERGGVRWVSLHEVGGNGRALDLNAGGAGSLLALAELTAELGEARHRVTLVEGARWLAGLVPRWDRALPGLYVGEAGIGAALLRAGQVLEDEHLIAEAAARGRRIAAMPYRSPDLFNGAAGRLRFHLLLHDATGDAIHLEDARQAGDAILAAGETAEPDGLRWVFPDGYDGLSGRTYLGYAHGAAGIADSLLDLFEATGETRFLEAAQAAGRWLARLAKPVLPDASGLDWSDEEDGPSPAGGLWCHGAAGVGRFFLHAARLGALPDAADLARRAGHAVARVTRRYGPTQCHGLAGSIEYLLDLYQQTGEPAWLIEVRELAVLLEAFAREQDGVLVWPSEENQTVSPDYTVGYAGVAACLLRLASPGRLPHQLSLAGFGGRRAGLPRRSNQAAEVSA